MPRKPKPKHGGGAGRPKVAVRKHYGFRIDEKGRRVMNKKPSGYYIDRGDTGSVSFVSSGHTYLIHDPVTGKVVESPRSAPGMRRRTVKVRDFPKINGHQLQADRPVLEKKLYSTLKKNAWWQYRYYRPYHEVGVAIRGHFTNAEGERVALDEMRMSTYRLGKGTSVEGSIRVALGKNLDHVGRSMRENGSIHDLEIEGLELTFFDLEEPEFTFTAGDHAATFA